ncbi:MAG TPA: DUF6402 family protein, partial [Limnobacter sp.]|nr:DUF6402 family protein [Limnobacter sp.]
TLYAMPARVQLSPLNSRSCKARVEGVLLYARDTFDFVGDQYLGHWGYGGLGINPVAAAMVNYIGVGAPPAWHPDAGWLKPATNQDFRNHRHLTGHGGDLLIFSDLKLHPARIEVEVAL